MTFDPFKPPHQQRNGRAAHISEVLPDTVMLKPAYSTENHRIICRIQREDGWWKCVGRLSDGRAHPDCYGDEDLINIPPEPARIKGWVNVYPRGVNGAGEELVARSGNVWATKEAAKKSDVETMSIACIPIEFTEGEGLS